MIEDVKAKKMSQLREGSFGRLLSHDDGNSVGSKRDRMSDLLG